MIIKCLFSWKNESEIKGIIDDGWSMKSEAKIECTCAREVANEN